MGRVFKENSILESLYDSWMNDSGSSEDLWTFIMQHPLVGNVLDLGCGTGKFTRLCAPYASHVVGLDVSNTMIKKAELLNDHHNITYLVSDMRTFSLSTSFDRILAMNDVLNFCASTQELQQVIDTVYMHLRVGGVFTFDVHHPRRLSEAGYSESGVLEHIDYEYMLEKDGSTLRHTFLWYESDYPTLEVFVQTLFDQQTLEHVFDSSRWSLEVMCDHGEAGFKEADKWMIHARRMV